MSLLTWFLAITCCVLLTSACILTIILVIDIYRYFVDEWREKK